MDINLFTVAMRTEFLRSMQAVAKPAPYKEIVTAIPSTARIENYAWMTPAPGIARYTGYRRGGSIDQIKYTLENFEYDGTITVPLRDIEDDQVGGYSMRMKDLAEKAKDPFESRNVMQTLANGTSTVCFDGTNFFATSHKLGAALTAPATMGGGGNALTFTAAASADGTTHRFCALVKTASVLKPLVMQKRKPAKFMTDAGTPASEKAKKADYWVDLEYGFGYGYWWDAINVAITGTPTIIELITCIDAVRQQFRGFSLPISLATDPIEYVHEQTQFNPDSWDFVCSTGLEQLFHHILYEDRIGVSVAGSTAGITSNIYYKTAGLIVSNRLNTGTP